MDYSAFVVKNIESRRVFIRKICVSKLHGVYSSYAEDAEQTTLQKIIQAKKNFIPKNPADIDGSFEAWISVICVRVCVDIHRVNSKLPLYDLAELPSHSIAEKDSEDSDLAYGRQTTEDFTPPDSRNVSEKSALHKMMQAEVCVSSIYKIYQCPASEASKLAATLKLVADMDYPPIAAILTFAFPDRFKSMESAVVFARKSVCQVRAHLKSCNTPESILNTVSV